MADELSGAVREQVQAELRAGRKISASKLYREATGLGLKEAKDAVEALEADFPATAPESSVPPARSKGGCMPMVALLLGTAAAGTWMWG